MIPNIGIYSFIPTFITYIVCIIVFYKVDFKLIKQKIKDLIFALLYFKNLENKKKKKKKIEKGKKNKKENEEDNENDEEKYKEENDAREGEEEKQLEKLHFPIEKIIKRNTSNKVKYQNFQPFFISYLKDRYNVHDDNPINNLNLNKKDSSIKFKSSDIDEVKNTEEFNKTEIINDKSKLPFFGDGINDNDIVIVKKNTKYNPPRKDMRHKREKKINEKNSLNSNSIKSKDKSASNKKKKISKEKIKRMKEILVYNEKELNELNFKSAIKYDKRNFIQIYYSFLKVDHIIIKILNSTDYNSRIIKIYLCFYNFSLSYTVNALFFNDDTIHQILEDEGKFNFIYQLPQIIYSSVISYFCGMILDFLALSEDNILEFKAERKANKIKKKVKALIKTLKIKFLLFFILSFFILLLFWYYLICFCVVYKNTQYHLIKDSLIGFITGLLTPLGAK